MIKKCSHGQFHSSKEESRNIYPYKILFKRVMIAFNLTSKRMLFTYSKQSTSGSNFSSQSSRSPSSNINYSDTGNLIHGGSLHSILENYCCHYYHHHYCYCHYLVLLLLLYTAIGTIIIIATTIGYVTAGQESFICYHKNTNFLQQK